MAFEGFSEETVAWFDGLRMDNSRAYFTAQREVYERAVRQPLLDLLTELSDEFGGEVKLFRQNRDVRFSADKSPYKTNAYGLLLGRPDSAAALYLAVSADGLQTATGYYEMAKDQLARFRSILTTGENPLAVGAVLQAIMDDLQGAGYTIDSAATKGMPRGIPKDAPNADLARFRSLTVQGELEPERMTDRAALEWVAALWRSAAPLNAWLDRHVGPSTLTVEEH